MVEIKEQYIPKEFHKTDPSQVKMHQHNDTSWNVEAPKAPTLESISITGKVGGINMLFQRLVGFSCDANVQLRIVNGNSQLSGQINVFRGNMLDVIEHLLHEIDLLAYAIAHNFHHQFEINFTCEQTIEFSVT